MRKKIAAANWKMNTTYEQGKKLLTDILQHKPQLAAHQLAIFAVPSPYLTMAVEVVKDTPQFEIAAQNCYSKESGAYTGEVAAPMLASIQVPYCVLGHSERREYFNESNSELAEKVNLCLKHQLTPIFCCGEPLNIREANEQNGFVETQLKESLFHLSADDVQKVIIAYEPIWAIGTGKTASAEQAQEIHQYIRGVFAAQYGVDVANNLSILYGGSVKGSNATEIFSQPDVDGGLVGGASLNAEEFVTIIKSLA
ncbi:triose-phosphate isomerase [Gynurincola endophyticus]|jgi:triosephosphate isomerase|uniref:triose-phosphate isomerase n=1 Tax=Gynurincola endophyticus TaxID=2479004 RepID=UPI000F8CEC7B|nr:triose-phosphate isomerase [Gynurincola endophyticus]